MAASLRRVLLLCVLLVCVLLYAGCETIPDNAVSYSEDAVYTFLEDAVLAGDASASVCFTGEEDAPDAEALDKLLECVFEQDGLLNYYLSELSWTTSALGSSAIRLTVDFTYDADADRTLAPLEAESAEAAVPLVIDAMNRGDFQLLLRAEGGGWDSAAVESLLLSAANNAALPCTLSLSYILSPSETAQRQWIVLSCTPTLDESDYAEYSAALKSALEETAAEIRTQADQSPRALYRSAHDAVIAAAEYNYELADFIDFMEEAENMGPEYTAYGALVEGSTVCFGYASAFKLLCDQLDLPCWSVSGSSEGEAHQWNLVRLEGEEYIVDCTWDDATGNDDYFLCSPDSAEYQLDSTSLCGW